MFDLSFPLFGPAVLLLPSLVRSVVAPFQVKLSTKKWAKKGNREGEKREGGYACSSEGK